MCRRASCSKQAWTASSASVYRRAETVRLDIGQWVTCVPLCSPSNIAEAAQFAIIKGMTTTAIEFEIDAGAAEYLPELHDELNKALAGHDLRRTEHQPPPASQTRTFGEANLAWIAILVALPAAAGATLNLADRMKLKPRVESLIAWAARLWKERDVRVHWHAHGKSRKPLDEATVHEIIEALSELAEQRRRAKP